MRENRTFTDALIEDLKDPEEARAYLEIALEEYEAGKNADAFLMALRHVAEALCGNGDPNLESLSAILHALGYRLAIAPLER